MSIAITCRKCGQALQLGADDGRTEIECLWCGATSPVPGRAAPTPAARTDATSSIRAALPAIPKKEKAEAWFEQSPYGLEGLPSEAIRGVAAVPQPAPPAALPAKPVKLDDDEEDGSPYQVGEKLNYRCQECGRQLFGEMVLCPSCGYNHETGKKVERTFEPVARSWEAGWPLAKRLRLFVITQAVMFVMTVLATLAGGSLAVTLPTWMLIAALTAYVIGTFDRVNLTRNKRGKVVLTHTWRFLFMERPARILHLGEFEGVTKGRWHEADFWDWMIFAFLFPFGIVPGIVWWYWFIHSAMFFVALAKDHGHPEVTLYRGWDEEHMRDLHDTLRAVAFAV